MSNLGNIQIADEVVKQIAVKTVKDVDGVNKLVGGVAEEVSKLLGKKKSSQGIKVEVGEKECKLDVNVIMDFGVNIPEVACDIQEQVVKNIKELTGLTVIEVNVIVQDVCTEGKSGMTSEIEKVDDDETTVL